MYLARKCNWVDSNNCICNERKDIFSSVQYISILAAPESSVYCDKTVFQHIPYKPVRTIKLKKKKYTNLKKVWRVGFPAVFLDRDFRLCYRRAYARWFSAA